MSTSDVLRFFGVMLLTLAVGSGLLLGVSRVTDPFWIWGGKGRLHEIRVQVDSRLQKINMARQPEMATRQDLLVGSSRTAGYPFVEGDVLNFSVNTLIPEEYGDAIRTATAIKGAGYRRLYLGLDFFTSADTYHRIYPPFADYLDRSSEPGYRWKSAVSLRSLQNSIAMVRANSGDGMAGCQPCYDGDYLFILPRLSVRAHDALLDRQMATFRKNQYAPGFIVEERYRKLLEDARAAAGNAHLVPFVTPEHARLLRMLDENGLFDQYDRFLRIAVATFGSVIVFDPAAPLTQDLHNYYDLHHPTRATATMISSCLESATHCDAMLGARQVDAGNIDVYLQHWRLSVNCTRCQASPVAACCATDKEKQS